MLQQAKFDLVQNVVKNFEFGKQTEGYDGVEANLRDRLGLSWSYNAQISP